MVGLLVAVVAVGEPVCCISGSGVGGLEGVEGKEALGGGKEREGGLKASLATASSLHAQLGRGLSL